MTAAVALLLRPMMYCWRAMAVGAGAEAVGGSSDSATAASSSASATGPPGQRHTGAAAPVAIAAPAAATWCRSSAACCCHHVSRLSVGAAAVGRWPEWKADWTNLSEGACRFLSCPSAHCEECRARRVPWEPIQGGLEVPSATEALAGAAVLGRGETLEPRQLRRVPAQGALGRRLAGAAEGVGVHPTHPILVLQPGRQSGLSR